MPSIEVSINNSTKDSWKDPRRRLRRLAQRLEQIGNELRARDCRNCLLRESGVTSVPVVQCFF